jgi:apolipoprotein N-acyltransferase
MNIPGVMRIGGAVGFWSIAKTQWMNPLILQLASFTGMYGVTFLIVLVNCAIAYAMIHYKETKRIFKPTIIVLCVLAVIFSYGLTGIPQKVEGNITVAVIQTPPTGENTAGVYINMSENALKYNPHIIIWPALMFEQLSINQHHNFSRDHNVYLVGSTGKDHEFGYGVLSPDGSISVDNLGHSMGTIPQYILARDVKGFFFPEVYSLKTDIGFFAVTDCIESGSALPTRDRVRDGAQFLVVPTGSPNAYVFSWALGTNAIYRAVEHRMFVAEVIGDYKGSMIIDPYGRTIIDIAPEPEIVVGKISFTNERTFYTKYGDIFGWGIVLTAITLIANNFHLKRKSPFRYCIECYANITKDANVCPTCGKRQKRKWWARTGIEKLTKNNGFIASL